MEQGKFARDVLPRVFASHARTNCGFSANGLTRPRQKQEEGVGRELVGACM